MEAPTSTFGLIERIKRGDQTAFAALFEKYRRRLAVLIHFRMGPRLKESMEVDDLLQETMAKAFLQLDRFDYRSPGSFFRWIAHIADHVITDAARNQNRQKRRAAEYVRFRTETNPGGAEPVDSTTPSRILARDEAFQALLRSLDALPPQYREVILLARFEGLTTPEIAEKLGKSRESVALLLHRALGQIRRLQRKPDPS